MPDLFLKQQYLAELTDIFAKYCPKAEIWAYGSRVKGNFHDGSDLDLCIKDFGNKDCSVSELKELINKSNIPILIDISLYDYLPDSFQKEIDKLKVKIFPQ